MSEMPKHKVTYGHWTRTCPKCQKEVPAIGLFGSGFGGSGMLDLKFGGVEVWSGCWECLGKLILCGIAAIDKVDALEERVKRLESSLGKGAIVQ